MTGSSKEHILEQIAERFDLDIIYAFGSLAGEAAEYVKGVREKIEMLPQSDIDIGVKPKREKHLSVTEKVQLSLSLEELFKVNKVDLVVIPEADPFVAANIIRGERLWGRDKHRADEYDLYILRRAGDLAPLERERISLIMGDRSQ